jgi:hypothetical protein
MPHLRPPTHYTTLWGKGVVDFIYVNGDVRLLLTKPEKKGKAPLRRRALRVDRSEINREPFCSIEETLVVLLRYLSESKGRRTHKKGVVPSSALAGLAGFTGQATKKKTEPTLRAPTHHLVDTAVNAFCPLHPHEPLPSEKRVIDHILELQAFNGVFMRKKGAGKAATILSEKKLRALKKILNSPANLQVLGSLQNRAKAWVFLKFLKGGFINQQTRCGCLACVAEALKVREHLRCAGSLRTLSGEKGGFDCLRRACERAWDALFPALAALCVHEELRTLSELRARMVECRSAMHTQ